MTMLRIPHDNVTYTTCQCYVYQMTMLRIPNDNVTYTIIINLLYYHQCKVLLDIFDTYYFLEYELEVKINVFERSKVVIRVDMKETRPIKRL